jgi:hypothetical protein
MQQAYIVHVFHNFPFLLQECIYSPESDDVVWLLFFFFFFGNQPTLSEKLVVYMMHVSIAMQKARGVGYFTYLPLLFLFSMELIIINFPVFPANVLTPDHDCTFEMQIQH